jgi:hypothetical protein
MKVKPCGNNTCCERSIETCREQDTVSYSRPTIENKCTPVTYLRFNSITNINIQHNTKSYNVGNLLDLKRNQNQFTCK